MLLIYFYSQAMVENVIVSFLKEYQLSNCFCYFYYYCYNNLLLRLI